jgi:hypothetical protein
MKFIKKYSALLIPAAIAFAALLLFIPTILTGSSIEQDMGSRLALSSQIRSLAKKTPSGKQPEQEKVYTASHAADARLVEQLVKQSTQRQLLAYGIFPRPQDQSPQLFDKFGEKIRTSLKELVERVSALDAPTEAEIRKETGRSTSSRSRQRGKLYGSRPKDDVIVDAFCGKRAESVPVYANPNIFEWYDFWENYKYDGFELAVEDCWYSQLAYWVYEDVIDTIGVMNTGSECVYTSPVKRLIGISFSGLADYVKSKSKNYGSSAMSDGDRPQYIADTSSQVLGVRPWTLRVCNDDIDVIHFSVAVIVGSKAVMPFMKELCSEKEHTFRVDYAKTGAQKTSRHNQITILQSEVEPIEGDDSVHANYRYGDGAIVRLNLICEYVLYRNGYDMIKPDTIKILLNQTEAETPATKSMGGNRTKKNKPSNKSKNKKPGKRNYDIDF